MPPDFSHTHEGSSPIRIAPSILSADLGNLESQLREAEHGGADEIHIDIMDGHFVPNITFGLPVVEAVRRITKLPIDVHLMVEEPEVLLEPLVKLGATTIDIHIEACEDPKRLITLVHNAGAHIGVAVNPETPLKNVAPIASEIDRILVMSVHPGFPAQTFLSSSLSKLRAAYTDKLAMDSQREIAVDGGIGPETANSVTIAGARTLIAGSAIFASSHGIKDAISHIRQVAEAGLRESIASRNLTT